MRIGDALDAYLLQLEADGRSRHTIGQARRHVGMLVDYIGGRDMDAVTHNDVAKFLTSAMACRTIWGELRKPTSANALRSSIRSFFGYIHASGMSSVNAGALVRRALVGPRPPRGLSQAEQVALLAELNDGIGEAAERDRALFGLLLATGIRLGSALALEGEDVDLDAGVLRLRSVKGGGEQEVYLPPAIVEQLRGLVREGVVFPITSRQAHRRLRATAQRAGIARTVSPHTLRHTFALGLYEKTSDLLLVQSALGHRSIQSTTTYARANEERVRRAVVG